MAAWPKWTTFEVGCQDLSLSAEEILAKDRVMSANGDFQDFKKKVLKSSNEEIDAEEGRHFKVSRAQSTRHRMRQRCGGF